MDKIFMEEENQIKLFEKKYINEINYMIDNIDNNIEYVKENTDILNIYRNFEKRRRNKRNF